ncbi:uncharacterized protein LOC143474763 [Brachyhypopomus gauderio]|uniref:uncharacterized protein LOC143474763 n=1 Tax=Brachyhypopomus gauderio TaxID=698409 RepID=UPI0040415CBF
MWGSGRGYLHLHLFGARSPSSSRSHAMALLFQDPVRAVQNIIVGLLLGLGGGYLMSAMVIEMIDILSSLRSASLKPLECCTGFGSPSAVTAYVAASGLTVAMLASVITVVVAEEVAALLLKPGERRCCGGGLAVTGLVALLVLGGVGALVGALMERIVVGMGLVRLLCTQMCSALAVSLLLCVVHKRFPAARDLFLFPWMLFYLPAAGMCAGVCGSGILQGSEIILFFFFAFLVLFLGLAGLGGVSVPASLLLASTLIFCTVLDKDGQVLSALRSEEATQSAAVLTWAVFLAVLAVLLCEMAASSTLLSFVTTARNRSASAWATVVGALLLLATRWCSNALGIGGSLGALLGVAGAVGVALTAAGEAVGSGHMGQPGHMGRPGHIGQPGHKGGPGQNNSPAAKVAATLGAASGAFLSVATPDVHFRVFMVLCTAAVTGVLSSVSVDSKQQ